MNMAIAIALTPLYVYLVAYLPSQLLKKYMRDGKLKQMLFREI